TAVAAVAEVEVERSTGRIWARRVVVAHDCGLVINPQGLRYTIEGNVVQGISRAVYEQVRFDRDAVSSVDWASYPILEMQDAPACARWCWRSTPISCATSAATRFTPRRWR